MTNGISKVSPCLCPNTAGRGLRSGTRSYLKKNNGRIVYFLWFYIMYVLNFIIFNCHQVDTSWTTGCKQELVLSLPSLSFSLFAEPIYLSKLNKGLDSRAAAACLVTWRQHTHTRTHLIRVRVITADSYTDQGTENFLCFLCLFFSYITTWMKAMIASANVCKKIPKSYQTQRGSKWRWKSRGGNWYKRRVLGESLSR